MQKRWFLKKEEDRAGIEKLRKEIKCDRILASLLLQRGISNYEQARLFFNPSTEQLHDPFLMKNMRLASNQLNDAITLKKRILLFGDYDVDGTTAVALMYSFLKNHTDELDYYIPDRYTEGYGLSKKGIDYAYQSGVKVMITLDCGIRSVQLVNYAKELGIQVIICDHHEPGNVLPDAIVLDPKQKDCPYPFKGLSGCGVGFKLLQALCQVKGEDESKLHAYLDLLAVSIGADIVDITGENRILAHAGLDLFNRKTRKAFSVLLELAAKELPVNLSDIVFTIAPRINAVGRLRSGRHAVELMISSNDTEIQRIAEDIHRDNQERRTIDKTITQEAVKIIETNGIHSNTKSLVLCSPTWHKGVVGIVASRIVEQYFKPTIILTESNNMLTGSARTVNDFDIHDAIASCEHLVEQYGGHCHAAGLTLKPENLEAFRMAFDKTVLSKIKQEDLIPEIKIDLEITFCEIRKQSDPIGMLPKLKRNLMRFEPHGPGNLQPVFISTNLYAMDSKILKNEHLKLTVVDPASNIHFVAIGFNLATKIELTASGIPFDMVYTLSVNTWKGRESLQLMILDIRAHEKEILSKN